MIQKTAKSVKKVCNSADFQKLESAKSNLNRSDTFFIKKKHFYDNFFIYIFFVTYVFNSSH